jgi:maltooligosyltrehalose trehalohydrolase
MGLEFKVWAPVARNVEMEALGGRHAMTRDEHGFWRTDLRLAAGTDYWFRVDGRDPRPDPRSPWQPAGVHGRSRTVDHGAFAWTDAAWQPPALESGVVYEMHVGTFTAEGTFDAAIARLDHVADLGVTHVEIMPVAEFDGARGWGYDGVDLFAPKHSYGGPDGLKRLVDACHARGLAVILDVVYNHLGPAGNYLEEFGPYFTDRYATPWGKAVNLDDAGSDEVRRFILDNALSWLRDYHFDGLRLDAVHALLDRSAVHLLEQLAGEVARLGETLGRRLVVIAESDLNDPRIVRRPSEGGYGMDAQWSDDYHHALHAAVTGEAKGYYNGFGSLRQVAKALTDGFVFDGQYAPSRGRRHGRPLGNVSGHRLLAYVQTHDQVGNRAKGERWSHLASEGAVHAAAALTLTAPYVPLLFQGEEWATAAPFQYFTDHGPELGRAVTEGRQREFADFGWDPGDVPDPHDRRAVAPAVGGARARAAPRHPRLAPPADRVASRDAGAHGREPRRGPRRPRRRRALAAHGPRPDHRDLQPRAGAGVGPAPGRSAARGRPCLRRAPHRRWPGRDGSRRRRPRPLGPALFRRGRRLVADRPVQAELAHRGLEAVEVHRLPHVAVDVQRVAPMPVLLFVGGGQDHDRQLPRPRFGAEALQHLQSVHARQLQVEEHDHRAQRAGGGVGPGAEEQGERLHAVARDDEGVRDLRVAERELRELEVVGIVLDEKDGGRAHEAPRVKKNVAPAPGRPSAQMRPPWRTTTRCAVARPMPVPSNSAASCRRWKGAKSLSA